MFFKTLFKNLFSKNSTAAILKQCVNNLKTYWILTLSIVAFTLISIFFFDKNITEFIITQKGDVALFFSGLGYILGQMHYPLLATIVLGLFFSFKNIKDKAIVMLAAIHAMIFAGIFVQIPKYLFGRARPFHGYEELSWFNNYRLFGSGFFSYKYMSMPSGDTITIAATMIVFALYTKNRLLKTIFFLTPLITVFTRVHISKHWLSDTLIGLSLGFLIGKSIYEYYNVTFIENPDFSFKK